MLSFRVLPALFLVSNMDTNAYIGTKTFSIIIAIEKRKNTQKLACALNIKRALNLFCKIGNTNSYQIGQFKYAVSGSTQGVKLKSRNIFQ